MPNLKLPRYVFPTYVLGGRKQLLMTCDAAANADGAVACVGVELADGSQTNNLFCSRFRLLSESVPRNELKAIRIGCFFLAYDIILALGEKYFLQFISLRVVHFALGVQRTSG